MLRRIETFLCSRGLHRFERSPSRTGMVRARHNNCFALTQDGTKRCVRAGCRAELRVYREGLCGLRGAKWRRLTPSKAELIRSLPHHLDVPMRLQ